MVRGLPVFLLLGLAVPGWAQGPEWVPPETEIPAEFVRGVKFMLAHGLPDPRGGEYREVKVPGEQMGEPQLKWVDTKGWVFPAAKGKPLRVVTVSGRIYVPAQVGEKADIDVDLAHTSPFLVDRHPSLMAAFLLVRGETARAERVYKAYPADFGQRQTMFTIARPFLIAWWSQAAAFHAQGKTDRVVELASDLARYRPDYEEEGRRDLREADRRRGVLQTYEDPREPVFPFVAEVDLLLTDAQRRLKEGRKTIDFKAIERLSPSQRVTALIEALAEVKAGFILSDTGADFSTNPVVRALVDEGEAALGPLFETVDQDQRFSKTVVNSRLMPFESRIVPVREVAIVAIQKILHTQTAHHPEELRALWAATQEMSPARRKLAVLQNDQMNWTQWLEAARTLFIRKNGVMPADSLRVGYRQDLTDALCERALLLAARMPAEGASSWELMGAMGIAQSLAQWDPEAALPVGQKVLEIAFGRLHSDPFEMSISGGPLGKLVNAMVQIGDQEALPRYNAWISSQTKPLPYLAFNQAEVFSPVVAYQDRPGVKDAARKAFFDEASAWNLVRLARSQIGSLNGVIVSPMVRIESVQDALIQILDDASHGLFGGGRRASADRLAQRKAAVLRHSANGDFSREEGRTQAGARRGFRHVGSRLPEGSAEVRSRVARGGSRPGDRSDEAFLARERTELDFAVSVGLVRMTRCYGIRRPNTAIP